MVTGWPFGTASAFSQFCAVISAGRVIEAPPSAFAALSIAHCSHAHCVRYALTSQSGMMNVSFRSRGISCPLLPVKRLGLYSISHPGAASTCNAILLPANTFTTGISFPVPVCIDLKVLFFGVWLP